MSILTSVRPFTRWLLSSAVLLILYSYLCRLWKIYFLWESGAVGWFLLFIGLILFLFQRIDLNTAHQRSSVLEKIAACALCFVTILWLIISLSFRFSDAYAVAEQAVLHNAQLKQNIGAVHRISIRPVGQIQVQSSDVGETGIAELHLIAEGEQKFQDVQVFLTKEPSDTTWVIQEITHE